MSIASQITRLLNAKAAIKTSLEAKGATVPSSTKLDGYASIVSLLHEKAALYKCASVDTGNKTWTGYKTTCETGVYVVSQTLVTGLAYTYLTPVVNEIYTEDALAKIDELAVNTASLRVNYPTGSTAPSGAQWSIDNGTTYYNFGATATGIQAGSYSITFKDVSGYTTPSSIPVSLSAGDSKVVTSSEYIVVSSDKMYVTSPDGFGNDIVGSYSLTSGTAGTTSAIYTKDDNSSIKILYKSAAEGGWDAFQIDGGSMTAYGFGTDRSGLYQDTAGMCSVYVIRNDESIIEVDYPNVGNPPDDGKWSIDNGVTWRDIPLYSEYQIYRGYAVTSVGNKTITYKPVTGYTTPNSQSVTTTEGNVTKVSCNVYVEAPTTGTLLVNYPSGKTAPAGAKWSYDSGATWYDFGTSVSSVTPEFYTIDFKEVSGYNTPPSQSGVEVEAGNTTTVTSDEYTEIPSTVQLQATGASEHSIINGTYELYQGTHGQTDAVYKNSNNCWIFFGDTDNWIIVDDMTSPSWRYYNPDTTTVIGHYSDYINPDDVVVSEV